MTRARLACIASAALLTPLAATGTAAAQAPGTQEIGQSAASEQIAGSSATSVQHGPVNQNISVRIGSPGDDGAVTQTNSSAASSAAGNHNATGQSASQGAAGPARQAIGQDASNAQKALSAAESVQVAPRNENISVRIHSPGDNGPVTQTNNSSATSKAGNANHTSQEAAQRAGGGMLGAEACKGCPGGSPAVQAIGQDARSGQAAGSEGLSAQLAPANSGQGPGGGGPVTQANTSDASSAAGNSARTHQAADQAAAPGFGTVVQAIGQAAANRQLAGSQAASLQDRPANVAGGAGGGAVDQRNTSSAGSSAGNRNETRQAARQLAGGVIVLPRLAERCPGCDGGGHDPAVQAIGQDASNRQGAWSEALSKQICPLNHAHAALLGGERRPAPSKAAPAPWSLEQLSDSGARSGSGNAAATGQDARQSR